MRRARTFAASLFAAGLCAVPAVAQDGASASVDLDRVGTEDVVQFTVTLEGRATEAADVPLPALQNLRLAGGPSVSTQVSFVNGAMSQSKSLTWTLQPLAQGRASIGPVSIRAGGQSWTTNPITLEVVEGRLRPERRRSRDPFGWDPFEDLRARQPREEPEIRVDVILDRDRVHVGEPVLATYVIDTQTNVTDIQLVDSPQYPGFWVEDLERPEGPPSGEPVTLDGERFQRFAIIRKLLFPTRAGELALPAATFRLGLPRLGFFDAGPRAVERSTSQRTIRVDPLPDDPGFSGAVGRFDVAVEMDRARVPLGEAATLRFRVSGSGNLKWVDAGPELEMEGARVYPPEAKSELKVAPEGMVGAKTWEYVVVPETVGSLEIPSLSFRYFDSSRDAMATAVTRPLTLEVLPGTGASVAAAATSAARRDGLALRTDLDLRATSWRPAPRTLGVVLGLALALHALLLSAPALGERLWQRAGHRRPRSDVRRAIAALERAAREAGSKETAAAAIERTLHDVFGSLDGEGGSEAEREARAVMQEVQFLRFAPQLGDYSERIQQVAQRAADVVRRFG